MVKRYFNPRAINYFYSSDLIDSLMKRLPRFTTTSFLKHVRRKDLLEETSTHYIELVKFIENRATTLQIPLGRNILSGKVKGNEGGYRPIRYGVKTGSFSASVVSGSVYFVLQTNVYRL